MKSKKQRKRQPKTSKHTDDIGDGENAAELSNVQDNGGEQQQAKDQPEVEEARDLDREGHSRKQVKGKKRHICQECPMSFDKMFRLKQHIRKHTGEQPFRCEQCNRRFAQLGNLNRHIRTHTGEKPFGCSSCGKHFANSHHLNRHLRTHTGEKPFGCSICGKRFAYAHHLRRHQQMKKDPCKPAAVPDDEEQLPEIDDDEHGEEQMSAEITQKAWDEVVQRHQQILARLSSCETRLTTMEQQLKTKGECQGSSAATAAIITSAKATTSTRNNPKKPQKRPATSSFSSNTKAGKAKRSPRPATSSTSSSSSADDECSREAEEPNSSGKEEEYIF